MGKLTFYRSSDIDKISQRLAGLINHELEADRQVLWLLSGGSSINIEVATARLISTAKAVGVTVGLVDERYGLPGHPDSNWTQLQQAGFQLEGAKLEPVLNGGDIESSTSDYDEFVSSFSNKKGAFRIGLLGIGADGHTAGLLPGSPAITSPKYIDYYQGPDFQRITLTGKGIGILDVAVVYAAGDSKVRALRDLSTDIKPSEQPAQLLKTVANVDVYNDVIGEEI